MKKSIYFLMIATTMLISFASCNNDENVDTGGGSIVSNGVATTAKITLTQSQPVTYAPTGTEQADPNEKNINTAILLIFDAKQSFEQAVSLDIDVYASKTITTTTGTHYFYAIVNETAAITDIVSTYKKGAISLNDVKKDVIDIAAIDELTTDDDFLMTSVGTPISKILISASVGEAETEGNENNFKIEVGRAVAKVNVYMEPDANTDPSGGVLTAVKYKIHNNPKQMYIVPKFEGIQLWAPFYSAENVITTSYFNNLEYLRTDKSEPSYAMENSNEIPKEGNATYISVKGVYEPKVVYNRNEVISTPAADKTFYRIWSAEDNSWNEKFFNENPYPLIDQLVESGDIVVKYTEGVCYYRLYLADNEESTVIAKHTVKRNTYFKVTITSVSGVGGSAEGGGNEPTVPTDPKPENPLASETNIHATIDVMPWSVIEQSGGI
ncbi:Mfa1 family fimbria major subunit [Dysgonomonas sp. ZJ709]|uniref:Mfa1 family fimbria major subunit n=1 Tax=Dysgonomonas sp. ZJ709 TaxID=2709797 RepID=UPI0013EB8956|nr:Mfa1 family fimbria major subunit [Dysgonomonas sp. ZJ709]